MDAAWQARDNDNSHHTDAIESVKQTAESAFEKAKEAAEAAKEKTKELVDNGDDEYKVAINEYNTAFTDMNDRGTTLHRQRERAVDVISYAEMIINSIANHPKSFDVDFEEIDIHRKAFTDAEEYATRELMEARACAGAGGAGLAAGAAVAGLAPTAAMWIATTFGTASTGAAISTLSGAAATNAALAWLGGGALATGGAGTAGGTALLALAGPVGWGIAGASLLASLVLFTKKRVQVAEERNKELASIKTNTGQIREVDAKIGTLLDQTITLREALSESFVKSMRLSESDYTTLSDEDKKTLGALVNNTKVLALLLSTKIAEIVETTEISPEATNEGASE